MPTKQLVIVIAIVAILSAGLGVAITSRMATKEVKVSLDIGGDKSLDVAQMADRLAGAESKVNEAGAIGTLRAIASAQHQAQSSGIIDSDGDSSGEYAYLGEMAGRTPLRPSSKLLEPALLVSSLGEVDSAGIVRRHGYLFRVYLPGSTIDGFTPGVPEASGVRPDHDNAELLWNCYAWPIESGMTGTRAFFINQAGDLREVSNTDRAYSGESHVPAFDAALSSEHPHDMGAPTALAGLGQVTNDGRAWTSVE